jgi:hypothetical protein
VSMDSRETKASKVLSMEDIRAGLSELAQNGEGAQRTQAYRILMSMSGGDTALPDPLSTAEAIQRMRRLMRGFGLKMSRIAFIQEFPRVDGLRKLKYEDLSVEEMDVDPDSLPHNLATFRKRYPETVAKGTPKGYPKNGGMEEIKAWCRREAIKIEHDRFKAMRAETQISLEEARRAAKDPDSTG